MAAEIKHVEEDYDDDELEELPARKVGGLKGASSGLGLKVERSAKNLKELEEAEIRGGDVVVNFHLPGGKTETATFPAGQDVAFLKLHLERAHGFPIAAQTFTLAGRVMIDPLSLSDYDAVVARKGPVDIEVKVA